MVVSITILQLGITGICFKYWEISIAVLRVMGASFRPYSLENLLPGAPHAPEHRELPLGELLPRPEELQLGVVAEEAFDLDEAKLGRRPDGEVGRVPDSAASGVGRIDEQEGDGLEPPANDLAGGLHGG